MFKTLDDQVLVAGQIVAADVVVAQRQGVTRIVNNRPEGEAADQTSGDAIAAAARAAGLDYVAVPMGHAGIDAALVEAMAGALDDGAKILAYCRSGTRSTILWALARASRGVAPEPLVAAAAAAGYDLAPYDTLLATLSAQARDAGAHA